MSHDHHTADDGPGDVPDPDDPVAAAAVARTRADLAAHAEATPPMPPGLLTDIDAALAAQRRGSPAGSPTARPGPAPRPRRRAVLAVCGALAGAAAAAAVVAGVLSAGGPAPAAAPAPSPGFPVLAGGDGPSALRAGLGRSDYGPLTDPGRLAGCLDAHGVPVGARPVGARQVLVDGRPGVLLVLPTGVAARFRLLVVEAGCAAGTPLTLSDTLVGR